MFRMKFVKKSIVIALLVVSFWLFGSGPALAIVITQLINESTEEVRAIASDPKLAGDSNKEKRRAKLRTELKKIIDFEEMAKRSFGSIWRHHPNRQKELAELFIKFLERAYMVNIESFEDEIIDYKKEMVDGNFAEVRAEVMSPKSGQKISVEFKLHRKNGDWKVYDVVIENVSMVNNYRSQFSRVARDGNIEGLMKVLREKGG